MTRRSFPAQAYGRQRLQLRAAFLRGVPGVVDVLGLVDEPVEVVHPQPFDGAHSKREARRRRRHARPRVDRRREADEHDERDPEAQAELDAAPARRRRAESLGPAPLPKLPGTLSVTDAPSGVSVQRESSRSGRVPTLEQSLAAEDERIHRGRHRCCSSLVAPALRIGHPVAGAWDRDALDGPRGGRVVNRDVRFAGAIQRRARRTPRRPADRPPPGRQIPDDPPARRKADPTAGDHVPLVPARRGRQRPVAAASSSGTASRRRRSAIAGCSRLGPPQAISSPRLSSR